MYGDIKRPQPRPQQNTAAPASSFNVAPLIAPLPSDADGIPRRHFYVHSGNFRVIAIAAYQNILFLLRIAKWKVASSKQLKFVRSEQLPYFSRVPDEQIVDTLNEAIDETFSDPAHRTMRHQARTVVHQLIRANTVTEIAQALELAFKLDVEGLGILGGVKYSTISPEDHSSSSTGSGIRRPHSRNASRSSTPQPQAVSLPGNEKYGAMGLHPGNPSGYGAPPPPPPSIHGVDDWVTADPHFTFSLVNHPERLVVSWAEVFGDNFLQAATNIAQALRDDRKDPSFIDFIAFHIGYSLLSQGVNPFNPLDSRFLGTPGFRKDTQTYVSLTDPGDGHVFGTTRKSRWMRGSIVHVEHLERPQNLSRDAIESYRIPSILDFSRVRLHTGVEAPNTYFVGRALRDSGEFGFDFIKIVNTTSSAATSAFQLGAAECKVAMDGLRTSQMVAYMRALAGHALRNHRQYFSAAFNLNHPIIDDLELGPDGAPRVLSEQMDIGRRGIELAAFGGFDKCTWDGAADVYPSHCIILQLGFQNALELVHKAHTQGLTTYMSAGFKFDTIQDAVLSGVDGIGIGGAQILRYMDGASGMHGPYTEEHIDKITVARDNAANSVRGRGAAALARLDQMHFEGSLSDEEAEARPELYEALRNADESDIQRLLHDDDGVRDVMEIEGDGERPWLGRARRLLRHEYPILRRGSENLPNGDELWEDFVLSLKNMVDTEDELGIHAYYQSEPWKAFRLGYRASSGEGKYFQGETRIGLKITPYSAEAIPGSEKVM